MFGASSIMQAARKLIRRTSRHVSPRARFDRQSHQYATLAVLKLEERIMPTMLGQQLFPSDYPWNQNIADAPVAANSAAIISHIGSSIGIHPDWGEDSASNGDSSLYGIPYNVVHGNTTAKVNVIIDNYPGESDMVPVPIPANAVIEGDYQNGPNPNGGGYNAGQRGDSHLLIWDEDTDTAYELYGVTRPSDPTLFPNTDGVELSHTDGQWHAAQESVWHMSEEDFRALGDTSADAAGLSILAGLARPDEGLPTSQGGEGAIDHALRFTLPSSDVAPQYIYPASHVVSESAGSTRLPLGSRLRLENTPAIDAQINAMGPEAQIIAHAMQQYGLILADIGSPMYVTGTSASQDANNNIDLTWNMNDVLGLEGLTAGDFQVLNLTPIVTSLSTSSGSAGNTITINGQNFSGAAGNLSVFFGATAAANVTYVSDSQITAVVPSGTGTVNVTVQSGVNETDPNNPSDNVNAPIFGYGTSAITTADQFTFSQGNLFAPPTLTKGKTGVYTVGGSAVVVDSTLGISSQDADLTGATVTISSGTIQSGDTLNYTTIDGITGSYAVTGGAGVLTLSGGSAPLASYQAALRSVTFSSTNNTNSATAFRSISFVADDSNASANSSPLTETLDVNPLVKPVSPGTYTAGSAKPVAIDSGVTVFAGANLTGATVSISAGSLQTGDTLNYSPIDGITTVSNSGGVLTLSGNQPAASYQAALRTVMFSNTTSTGTANRSITIAVSDTTDGLSDSTSDNLKVDAPVTISAVYVSGSSWTSAANHSNTTEEFDAYLAAHGLGSATYGYSLAGGSTQTADLPWSNMNQITVAFSGSVSNIGVASLKLVGGTGGGSVAAPSVSSITTDGSNTYTWTLSGALGENKYYLAVATTGSSFGTSGSTQVVDSNGAGISGTFTTGQSFPSGNHLADSTFDYLFYVLPGDGHQQQQVSSNDAASAKAINSDHETSAGYSPYYDYLGAGLISSPDAALSAQKNSTKTSTITAPSPPSAELAGGSGSSGSSGFSALALGSIESTSSSSSSSSAGVANVGSQSVSTPSSSAAAASVNSSGAGVARNSSSATSGDTVAHGHGRHRSAAVDEALEDLDLSDLFV